MTEVDGVVQALAESLDVASNSEALLITDKPQIDITTATRTRTAAAKDAKGNLQTVLEAEQTEHREVLREVETIQPTVDTYELQEEKTVVLEKEAYKLSDQDEKMSQEKEIVLEQQSQKEALKIETEAISSTTITATTATKITTEAATALTLQSTEKNLDVIQNLATKQNGKTITEEEILEDTTEKEISLTAASAETDNNSENVADIHDAVTSTLITRTSAVAISNCSNETVIAQNHVVNKQDQVNDDSQMQLNETGGIASDEEDQPNSASMTKSQTSITDKSVVEDNNGIVTSTVQKLNDTNSSSSSVVVLGDDSDVEMCEVPKSQIKDESRKHHDEQQFEDEQMVDEHQSAKMNLHKPQTMDDPLLDGDVSTSQETNTDDMKKSISVCSDSDGAVVINSDSESETCTKNSTKNRSGILYLHTLNQLEQQKKISQHQQAAVASAGGVAIVAHKHEQNTKSVQIENNNDSNNTAIMDDDDDDDDDDCVVIEDSSTAPAHCVNDINKRKSIVLDNGLSHNQPPNKRQRCLGNMTTDQLRRDSTAYPVSISAANTAATAVAAAVAAAAAAMNTANTNNLMNIAATGPPKLVAMSSANNTSSAIANNVAGTTVMPVMIGGMSGSATLLPGLTDDMFVLEAPSFIVPYIYEKPPPDNLKNICREIEQKFKLTKEDMAEADKSDEFDMMTEQNKDDKSAEKPAVDKKKIRARGADDPDESWSEESDEDDDDDDDDDSDTGMRTKVLIKEASDDLTALKGAIKPASAVVQSVTVNVNTSTGTEGITFGKTSSDNYFESPLGRFFMDIGVGLVQEYVQSDLIRLQKRKMRKSLGKNITEYERAIAALSGNLEASKKKNSPFKFTLKRCEFCHFKSESALAMANHYETPHMNGIMYKCNFCTYEIRNSTEIIYHMEAMHNIKARLIKALPYHQCPNCGFEDNGKAKLARHQPVCAKKFRPELNLVPPADWEAPAKIPRIKPRHGLVGTATAYQAMAAQAAAQKAALASIQQQQHVSQARGISSATIAAQNANKLRGRPPSVGINSKTLSGVGILPNNNTIVTPNVLRGGTAQVRAAMPANVVLSNTYQLAGAQLLQQSTNTMAKKPISGQPSISITPLPRQNVSAQSSSSAVNGSTSANCNSKMSAGMKTGQNAGGSMVVGVANAGNTATNNKAQYVICEICDGYIKDLDQLRNHMQWMHKVKIHPKMIYNRPPLNCQKCQFRFFTDQGLERHLLGSHGLVTSSMQEAANKGKDAGRCPVCGRMYQWKLLNHVSREHHMTLKPAHLSYKCTVCTATFGMYKQFETHVYTAHSTVAKKAMDGKKNNTPTCATTGGATITPSSGNMSGISLTSLTVGLSGSSAVMSGNQLARSNDSLLKPLKINDEITIIPQPATKPRITNMESHVID